MSRVLFFTEPGGYDVFKVGNVEDKSPSENEVLVKHTAIGVNYMDTLFRSGARSLSGTNKIIGYEACGVIKEKGSSVKGFNVGDRVVYATAPLGSYRETRCIDAKYIISVPDEIDDITAAASFFKGLTAHYLLCRAFIAQPGNIVLVHSAAGGVGNILCQWLNSIGVMVVGTVGDDEKKKFALKNGCRYVFNRNKEDWVKSAIEITKGNGVNAVYDFIGKDTLDGSIKATMKFGMLVLCGYSSGKIGGMSYNSIASKSLFLTAPSLFDYKENRMELVISANDLFSMLIEKKMNINIAATYPLEEAGKGHELLESRKTTGSIVLIP